jgi:hypothetical protein
MNYYGARQRKEGGFDYTCMNDGHVWPIGYCTGWREWKDVDVLLPQQNERGRQEREAERARIALYHTDGHPTEAEAGACYRRYLLDHRLRLDMRCSGDMQRRCQAPDGCEAWTQTAAEVDNGHTWFLCDAHRNRETVELLMPAVGQAMASW